MNDLSHRPAARPRLGPRQGVPDRRVRRARGRARRSSPPSVRAVAHDDDSPDRTAPSDLSLAAHAVVRDHRLGAPLGDVPSSTPAPSPRPAQARLRLERRRDRRRRRLPPRRGRPRPHPRRHPRPRPRARPRRAPAGPGRRQRRRRRGRGARRQPALRPPANPRSRSPHPSWLHIGFVDVGAPAITSLLRPRAHRGRRRSSDLQPRDRRPRRRQRAVLQPVDADDPQPGLAAIRTRQPAPPRGPRAAAVAQRRPDPHPVDHRGARSPSASASPPSPAAPAAATSSSSSRPARASSTPSASSSSASTATSCSAGSTSPPPACASTRARRSLAPRRLLQARRSGPPRRRRRVTGLPAPSFAALDPGSLDLEPPTT
jgi:hypothetical protein